MDLFGCREKEKIIKIDYAEMTFRADWLKETLRGFNLRIEF